MLNEALNCLRASPLRVTASHICRLADLDTADLSRMRRLHLCPQYVKLVNKFKIWRLLHYLLQEFPTLEIREYSNGKISVRLYKERKGRRLKGSLAHITPPGFKFHPGKNKD